MAPILDASSGSAGAIQRAAWVLLIVCTSTLAHAQAAPAGMSDPAGASATAAVSDDDAYEQLIDRALAAFRANEYGQARALFEQAHAMQPSARTLRGLGITAVALRRYDEARGELEAALIDPRRPLSRTQQRELTKLLDWMRTSLARLRLELEPAHATALVDGRPAHAGELLLDPGEHELRVQAEGYESEARHLSLRLGQTESLHVQLSPAAAKLSPSAAAATATATRKASTATSENTQPTGPRDEVSIFDRWWFWTGLAAVAIGGAVAAIALDGEDAPVYEQGGVGGVHRALLRAP